VSRHRPPPGRARGLAHSRRGEGRSRRGRRRRAPAAPPASRSTARPVRAPHHGRRPPSDGGDVRGSGTTMPSSPACAPRPRFPPVPAASIVRLPLSRLAPLPTALPGLLAWQHDPGGATALLRQDGDTLTVLWPPGPVPDLGALLGDPGVPDLAPLATPRGRACRCPRRPPVALAAGPPHLASEPRPRRRGAHSRVSASRASALTAWHATRRLAQRWQGSPLWPFGRR
jgi:hypothetical protein